MRTFRFLLLTPLIAWAQFPPAQLTGTLLERDPGSTAGEFSVRGPNNEVFRFQFDAHTAVRVDGLTSVVSALNPGEKVKVDSGAAAGSLLYYAHNVEAVTNATAARLTLADSRIRAAMRTQPLGVFQPDNLTFAGVVSRLDSQRLILRTRVGEQTVLIRKDTSYIDNGDTVEAAELRPNMRVFVRAGKDLYEQVEAYQVIWGKIMEVGHQ